VSGVWDIWDKIPQEITLIFEDTRISF